MSLTVIPAVQTDLEAAAKAAKLRYVSDEQPGYFRKRRGQSFVYYDAQKKLIRDQEELERIRKLVIPPAWENVWICASPNGHIQATGRDQRGRKQYRYHDRWLKLRNETKFERMLAFGEALPRLRARVEADLKRPGLPREKVLATVVRLLETTLIRVGNDEYARENGHYGLTTLTIDHVEVENTTIHFRFQGKSGKNHDIAMRDRRLSRIIKACQELPGQSLFEYVDADGQIHSIDSAAVNEYLHAATEAEFTAKDFRTWAGTLCAARALAAIGCADCATRVKSNLSSAIKQVARRLGNTAAICRKYYVHPAILDAYAAGQSLALFLAEDAKVPLAALEKTAEEVASIIVEPAEQDCFIVAEKALMQFLRAAAASGTAPAKLQNGRAKNSARINARSAPARLRQAALA